MREGIVLSASGNFFRFGVEFLQVSESLTSAEVASESSGNKRLTGSRRQNGMKAGMWRNLSNATLRRRESRQTTNAAILHL